MDTSNPICLTHRRIFTQRDLSEGTHTIRVVNTGRKGKNATGIVMDVDAFIVSRAANAPQQNQTNEAVTFGSWRLVQDGVTGLNATQLAVLSSSRALVIGEHVSGSTVPGGPSCMLYDRRTYTKIPLDMSSGAGTFLENGTFITAGGGSLDAYRDDDIPQVASVSPPSLHFIQRAAQKLPSTKSWASDDRGATLIRDQSGATMLWVNHSASDASSTRTLLEHSPPRAIPSQSPSQSIHTVALAATGSSRGSSSAVPHAILLPDGTLFLATNQEALIYDSKSATERRLPTVPCAVRRAVLVPLLSANNYTPEVFACGDSAKKTGTQDKLNAMTACFRMIITEDGIARGWQRAISAATGSMSDAVLLPTGHVLLLRSAVANDGIADMVLYDPRSWSTSTSNVSGSTLDGLASLTPAGDVMLASPDGAITFIQPPCLAKAQPEVIGDIPGVWGYGDFRRMILQVRVPETTGETPDIQGQFMRRVFSLYAVLDVIDSI